MAVKTKPVHRIFRSLIFFFFVVSLSISINAGAADLCVANGYTLGFFNGVWNTPREATDGLAALRSMVGNTYNSEPIQYPTFRIPIIILDILCRCPINRAI
jgi:hypothetical protein